MNIQYSCVRMPESQNALMWGTWASKSSNVKTPESQNQPSIELKVKNANKLLSIIEIKFIYIELYWHKVYEFIALCSLFSVHKT